MFAASGGTPAYRVSVIGQYRDLADAPAQLVQRLAEEGRVHVCDLALQDLVAHDEQGRDVGVCCCALRLLQRPAVLAARSLEAAVCMSLTLSVQSVCRQQCVNNTLLVR